MIKQIHANLSISCVSKSDCMHLYSSISPDDYISEEIVVQSRLEGNRVFVTINTRRTIGTLKNTLDDILRALVVIEKIQHAIKEQIS
ncbi:MAG: hypothetical protein DRO67_04155 [Candidatus Asgardarchaeum californiense]|nr:MAG: hypothetical protein DRO67_04155 [Candidatus Asgardarchaeum californiense]